MEEVLDEGDMNTSLKRKSDEQITNTKKRGKGTVLISSRLVKGKEIPKSDRKLRGKPLISNIEESATPTSNKKGLI